jgi:hypothetical protein
MKRITLFVATAAAALAGAASATAGHPHTHVRLWHCHHALAPLERHFDLAAGMHRVHGTRRMAIRFDLFVRHRGSARFALLDSPGYGEWIKSPAWVRGFRYLRRVNGLDAPAAYRVRVGFRWYAADGHVQHTAHRLSRPCFEPDMRPDLHVEAIGVRPGDAARDRYAAVVRNRGRTAAGPFTVTLQIGDQRVVRRNVDGLAADRQTRVGFGLKPACDPAAPPTLTLDAAGTVDESDETDDVVPVPCPG